MELLILIALWKQNVPLNLAFFEKVLVIFERRKRKLYYFAEQLKWLTDEIGSKKNWKINLRVVEFQNVKKNLAKSVVTGYNCDEWKSFHKYSVEKVVLHLSDGWI